VPELWQAVEEPEVRRLRGLVDFWDGDKVAIAIDLGAMGTV
jgi:hypothetical protein